MIAQRDLAPPFQVRTHLAPTTPRYRSGLPGNPRIALLFDALDDASVRVSDGTRALAALQRHFPRATVYPLAAHLDLRDYDLLISGGAGAHWSHWLHGTRTNPLAVHVRYCHTPSGARVPVDERDLVAARQIDHFVARSRGEQERIARHYGRASAIIHPPLDFASIQPRADLGDYYLLTSPLVPAAHVEVAVRAFSRLGLPLLIVGDGPRRRALRHLAGPTVRLLGRVPPAQLCDLYARCRALISLTCEDLPRAPLEAQVAGRPVLALAAGGAREIILEGTTGAFFPALDPAILADAVLAFDPDAYRPSAIQRHARSFGEARFVSQFHVYLSARLNDRLGAPVAPAGPARVIHLAPLPSPRATAVSSALSSPRGVIAAPSVALPSPRPGITLPSVSPPRIGEGPEEQSVYAFTKRLIDIAGSCAGLLVLAPLLAVIALLVKAEDHGPVLHHREIVGREGKHFYALKFRTMIPDADGYLRRHPDLMREYQANIKLRRDPRITRIGAKLRRTSLDELPQLVNVLRGQMSLVGPRMIHPSEEARYGDFALQRRTMLPGITGLWQVSGRQEVNYEQRVILDRQYLRERSIWLDLTILLRTFVVVFRRQGAY